LPIHINNHAKLCVRSDMWITFIYVD